MTHAPVIVVKNTKDVVEKIVREIKYAIILSIQQ